MKLNIKAAIPQVVGVTAGTAAGGVILGFLAKGTLSDLIKGAVLVAVGAVVPQLVGARGPMAQAMGNGIIAKGSDLLLKASPLGGMLAGIEEGVAGDFDDELSGVDSAADMPGVVAGPEGYDAEMSGTGGNVA